MQTVILAALAIVVLLSAAVFVLIGCARAWDYAGWPDQEQSATWLTLLHRPSFTEPRRVWLWLLPVGFALVVAARVLKLPLSAPLMLAGLVAAGLVIAGAAAIVTNRRIRSRDPRQRPIARHVLTTSAAVAAATAVACLLLWLWNRLGGA